MGPGNEARTYLAAILDHWDRLPDAVAFVHAHNSTWHTRVVEERNSTTWRLQHLRWPLSEPYVPLSVSGGCQGRAGGRRAGGRRAGGRAIRQVLGQAGFRSKGALGATLSSH